MAPKKNTTEFIPEIKLIPKTLKNGDIIYESDPSIFENYWQNGITEAYEHDNYTMMSDVPENAETRNETQMKYTFDSLKDIPRQTNQIFNDIYIPNDKNKFDKRSLNFHVLYDCIPFKKSLHEILLSGSYKQVLQALLRMPFVAYIYIVDANFKPFHEDDKYTYSDKFWYAFCLYDDISKQFDWFLIEPFTLYFKEAFRPVFFACKQAFSNMDRVNKATTPNYSVHITEGRTKQMFFESTYVPDAGLPLISTVPKNIPKVTDGGTPKSKKKTDVVSNRQSSIDKIMKNTAKQRHKSNTATTTTSNRKKNSIEKIDSDSEYDSDVDETTKKSFAKSKREELIEEIDAEDLNSDSEEEEEEEESSSSSGSSEDDEDEEEEHSEDSEYEEEEDDEDEVVEEVPSVRKRSSSSSKKVESTDLLTNNINAYTNLLIYGNPDSNEFNINTSIPVPMSDIKVLEPLYSEDDVRKMFARNIDPNENRFLEQCRNGYNKQKDIYAKKLPDIYGVANELDITTKPSSLPQDEANILGMQRQRFVVILDHFARFGFLKSGLDNAELDIDAMISKFIEVNSANANLMSRITQAEANNTIISRKNLENESLINTIQDANEKLDSEVIEINTQLVEANKTIEVQDETINTQKADIEQLKRKIVTLESIIKKTEPASTTTQKKPTVLEPPTPKKEDVTTNTKMTIPSNKTQVTMTLSNPKPSNKVLDKRPLEEHQQQQSSSNTPTPPKQKVQKVVEQVQTPPKSDPRLSLANQDSIDNLFG